METQRWLTSLRSTLLYKSSTMCGSSAGVSAMETLDKNRIIKCNILYNWETVLTTKFCRDCLILFHDMELIFNTSISRDTFRWESDWRYS